MRFSTAAVVLLAAAPAAAFVPSSFGGVTSQHHRQRRQQVQQQQQHQYESLTQLFADTQQRRATATATTTANIRKQAVSSSSSPLTPVIPSAADLQANKPTVQSILADAEEEVAAQLAAIETRAGAAAYLAQYEGQSGASLVYTKLQEHGVTVVNGFSGGAVLPVLDQFHPQHPRHQQPGSPPPIRWITNSNESSAGHIAEGYAKSIPIKDPVTGKDIKPVGVVVATSGPGVTNLITPLQDAICDGVPMVVLCGQAATVAPPDAFQSSPAVDLTRPCTKWSYQIKSAAEVPLVMDYAFYVATHGRPGPVFIDLPKDLQNQIFTSEMTDAFIDANNPGNERTFARLYKMKRPDNKTIFQALRLGTDGKGLNFDIVKDEETGRYKLEPVSQAAVPADQDSYHADHHPSNTIYTPARDQGPLTPQSKLAQIMLQMITSAKKPVIIAGQGCNDASEELKEFAEALQIPVTTTLHGLGAFDERSPLALNMMGMHGHATPNLMVQECDVLICIGSRFDDRITGRMADFIPAVRQAEKEQRGGVIHVDVRFTEFKKQVVPTYFCHSTGKQFLRTMNEMIAANKANIKPRTQPWLSKMKELQRDFPIKIPHFATEHITVEDPTTGVSKTLPRTRMSAQSVIEEMDRQILEAGQMDNALFSTGVGIHQMVAAQFITWTQPRQMLSSGSLGTMGVALGYAIGAKLANGKKMVISVDGDGSFNMTFTELKTLVEQGIPIKIMILDNDGQMMVEYWQRLFHNNRLLAVRNNANPDYVKLAGAFGIKALYCDAKEDLPAVMKQFLFDDPDKPVLFHVRIERTPCLPMVAPGQPLDDMILEDVEVDVEGKAAPS